MDTMMNEGMDMDPKVKELAKKKYEELKSILDKASMSVMDFVNMCEEEGMEDESYEDGESEDEGAPHPKKALIVALLKAKHGKKE